ncbi:hypothetical protein V6N13_037590 [Hibiscus sabdariffa]|uniref:Ubiquitin-like domain-containing protein n=1 Tax=Hibiscus sabdariffa TaxID=183260 RepID=A0ABR2S4M6_9ROSI
MTSRRNLGYGCFILFQIFINPWSGRTITLNILPRTAVDDAKNKNFKTKKIRIGLHVSITFAGKRLKGGCYLGSYSIQKGCTLCIALAPSLTITYMKVKNIGSHISHFYAVRTIKEATRLGHCWIDKETTLTVVF